jgi:hypothetical protein
VGQQALALWQASAAPRVAAQALRTAQPPQACWLWVTEDLERLKMELSGQEPLPAGAGRLGGTWAMSLFLHVLCA